MPHFEKVAHSAVSTATLSGVSAQLAGMFPGPSFLGVPKPLSTTEWECNDMDVKDEIVGGRKRGVMLRFRVTEAERDMIFAKMALLGTNNLAAYMRKIAIDGYIISTDYSDLKAVAAEMQKIGVNINQITRRINSTSRIYEHDFVEMQRGIDEIWRLLKSSLSKPR